MNILDTRMILGINCALHQEKISVQKLLQDISLQDFFNKLKSHSVEALVYTALADPYNLDSIDKEAAQLWKKETLFSTIYQQEHTGQMESFFKACNENNIPIIALKGLLLKDLYPNPNTRTMCDADVLVHQEDMDTVCHLLTQLGYTAEEEDDSEYHLTFSHPDFFHHIEVHWTLCPRLSSNNAQSWVSQIWQHCTTVQYGQASILSLSLEDHLIFLCLHMLSHIRYYGFGIRQLCDFYLFIKHYEAQLDWKYFSVLVKSLNISNLFSYTINTCQKLFNMSFSNNYIAIKKIKPKQLDYFINTLFKGGVYGYDNKAHAASIRLYRIETEHHSKGIGKIIFPDKKRLSDHYPYITKYPYLYPVAWLQNLWRLYTRDDFSLLHKLSIFFFSSRRINQHDRLLKELES